MYFLGSRNLLLLTEQSEQSSEYWYGKAFSWVTYLNSIHKDLLKITLCFSSINSFNKTLYLALYWIVSSLAKSYLILLLIERFSSVFRSYHISAFFQLFNQAISQFFGHSFTQLKTVLTRVTHSNFLLRN